MAQQLVIASSSNPKIKQLKKLAAKKDRDQLKQFVVENPVSVADAAQAGFWPQELYLTKKILAKAEQLGLNLVLAKLPSYHVIEEKVSKAFSNLSTPSGLAAVFAQPSAKLDWQQPCLYLNEVSDPGNVGTILRTALAFGFRQVVLDEGCADVYGPKVVSAAKEALFKLQVLSDEQGKILASLAKKMPLYVTSPQGQAKLSTIKANSPYVLVIGNEGHGVSPAIMKKATAVVGLEHSENMESLNVAVATGIILHELWRQAKKNK